MPVPLAPYPAPVPLTPPANGAQSQLVCSGCRNLLLYPIGAASVCCAVCSAVTSVPPPGTEMAQLVCGGCHTLLIGDYGYLQRICIETFPLGEINFSSTCRINQLLSTAEIRLAINQAKQTPTHPHTHRGATFTRLPGSDPEPNRNRSRSD
ncbi:protein LOL1 [Carex littledalei]|uniref:Protein LOL1 n=1 Tax=Carex littledalei TaxID=544730 RepID=A0A833VPH3_9POAL|nr:protein LOL1 [Carex littledalei]